MFYINLRKIKNKGDFKGSHKKTDRAFKNRTAYRVMNHTILSYFFFKKHVMEAKRTQEFPLGQAQALVLTGIQVGVHTSLKNLT